MKLSYKAFFWITLAFSVIQILIGVVDIMFHRPEQAIMRFNLGVNMLVFFGIGTFLSWLWRRA